MLPTLRLYGDGFRTLGVLEQIVAFLPLLDKSWAVVHSYITGPYEGLIGTFFYNSSTIPSSETCPEFILGTKSAQSLKLVEISMLRRPKTRFHHRVEQLPDALIIPDMTYLHSVRFAVIERIVPPPQRLIYFLIISRNAFSPQKGCTARCPWSPQVRRTPATHHHHRPFIYEQEIDVSSRDPRLR